MTRLVGVTQKQIENEFYMLDLVKIAKTTRKYEAMRKLELLNIVNSSRLEKADYRSLVDRYIHEADIAKIQAKFNRSKFEELRAMTPKRG